ncbi:MAG: diguanylate cyclase [Gallionella sp.]|jgi:diguanylate cyclase (GGDEF)-like protein/PAS domain S-box-containing protein
MAIGENEVEPSRISSGERRYAWLLTNLCVAAVYLLLASIVHGYFTSTIASVLWPSSGLALAVLLLGGRRYAWGVFLGALLTHVHADSSVWTPVPIAIGNTLEALGGVWLLTRDGKFDVQLRLSHDYARLILLGGCVAGFIGAATGPTVLLIAGIFTPDNYLIQMLQWWMGDVLGVVLIAPLILVWRQLPANWLEPKRLVEVVVFFALALLAGQIIFLDLFHDTLGPFARGFWMVLFITWAAVRLGMHGVLLVLIVIAVQALLGAYSHVGLFDNDLVQTHLMNFWFYIITLSVVGMLLATYISTEKRDKEVLRGHEEFFRTIAEGVDDFIAVLDLDGRRLYNSQSYGRIFGSPTGPSNSDCFANIHPDDRERIRELFNETIATGVGRQAEFRFVLPDGSLHMMESRGGLIRDNQGKPLLVLVVSHDITERKLADEKIRSLVFYDALTQLPNRRLLKDRMTQAMAACKRGGHYGAVMFIDLDNFKPLNDLHGHAMGDALLVEAAQRISRCVREVDTVARFGGDEFVVILGQLDAENEKSATEALRIAEKIGNALAEIYVLKSDSGDAATVEHRCTSSMGVMLFTGHEFSQDNLLKAADMAMYQAKRNGRNQVCFAG